MKIICELQINMSETVILAVCLQLKQLRKKPEKNSGLNGIDLLQCTLLLQEVIGF